MNQPRDTKRQLLCTALLTAALTLGGLLLSMGLLLGRDGLSIVEGYVLLRTLFVEDVDTKEVADQVLSAMEEAAGDRWSRYMDAEWYEQVRQNRANQASGIGVRVLGREEGLLITDVTPDSGADRAGLCPGEYLIRVEDRPLFGEAQRENLQTIAGEAGTTVPLQVQGEDGLRTVEVERGVWFDPPVRSQLLEDGVGYVRLFNFNTGSAKAFCAAVEELMAQEATALVLDVRQNGGGYLDELEQILDFLLPEGEMFRQECLFGVTLRHRSDAACIDLPKVVLLDSGSYSAAELFAAQLRESEGVLLVGEHTTGKGYFQYPFRLPNGGALNLSIGKYTTGAGVSLAQTGVEPDRSVALSEEQLALFQARWLNTSDDPQIQAALDCLREKDANADEPGRF